MTDHPNKETVLAILRGSDVPAPVGWIKDSYLERIVTDDQKITSTEFLDSLARMRDAGEVKQTLQIGKASLWEPVEREP